MVQKHVNYQVIKTEPRKTNRLRIFILEKSWDGLIVIFPQFVIIKNTVTVYHDAEDTHTLAPDECPHI